MQTQTSADELQASFQRTETYLASDPDNLSLLARAADLALAVGEAARARHHVVRALALKPDDPYFRFRLARGLTAERHYEQALALLEPLLAAHHDVHIATTLAQCQARLGRHADALAALEAFRDDSALTPEGATGLVRALHHSGRLEEGAAFVTANEARFGQSSVFCAAASLLFLDLDDAATSMRLSRRALDGGGELVEALVADATLAAATDPARAIAGFQRVLATSPEDGRSWSGLGSINLMLRDFDAALPQLETARRHMPHHVGTLQLLGWCRLFKGDLDGAAREFGLALDEDRNFAESHGALAVVHAMRGERAACEEALERALRLDRESLSARYAQMILSGEAADPERFGKLAMKLLSRRPMPGGQTMADVVRTHVS